MTSDALAGSTNASAALPSGFARRIERALRARLSDEASTCERDDASSVDGGTVERSSASMGVSSASARVGGGANVRRERIDLAACAAALSDILASQHKGSTPCAMVNVRAACERRGLALNESFLDASMRAQSKLNQVEATLAALDEARERMRNALESSKQRTNSLLREAERAKEDLKSIEARRELVRSFAVDFQLTKAQVDALTLTEDDSAAVELPSAFFPALERVKVIQSNCAKLTKDSEQQRAGLELMDVMTSYAETAHEKLRRFFVAKCRLLAEEDDFITELDEKTLREAVRALSVRSTLFRASVEEVTRTRHNALFRRFITALTRGGAGTKPLEIHANDPLRYVGDMLSWVHSAVASEKEFCATVFGDDDDDRTAEDEFETFNPTRELLAKVFDAVCRPLKVRVEQVLASESSAAEGRVMTAYKLAHLLTFFRNTLVQLLNGNSALVTTMNDLRESSKTSFADAVAQHGGKYRKLSLAPVTLVGDDALAPPLALREGVTSAIELLEAVAASGSASTTGSDDETREILALALNGLIDPIVFAVHAAETKMAGQMNSVIGSSAVSAPKWAPAAWALNCLSAIREPLRLHAAASAKVSEMNRAISKKVTDVADAEADSLLASTGLSDALELVVLYQEQGSGANVMANDPALKIDRLATALSTLVDSAGTKTPEFDAIQALSARRDVVARYNERLVEAYTRVYAALLTPSSGYGDVRSRIRHRPDALSTVLGGL